MLLETTDSVHHYMNMHKVLKSESGVTPQERDNLYKYSFVQ